MADWNLPTITSGYINFVDEMNGKFTDAATLQFGSPINIPLQTIRYNRSINLFQEWLGPVTGWQNKVLSVAGGGTGAATSAGIIANLGLGSMATQNSNAVNITGGSISGVSFNVSSATGVLALAAGGTGSSLALGPEGYVLMSHSGIVQFASGGFITELNGGAIIYGTVPDARLSTNIATRGSNNFAGDNVFDSYGGGQNNFAIRSAFPLLNFQVKDLVSTGAVMRFIQGDGALTLQAIDNTYTYAVGVMTMQSNGTILCSGVGIANLNANNLTTGIVPLARLGAGGAPNTTTFLRGDNTWQVPPTGGGGTIVDIPSGLIALFDTACPAGWTRFTPLDGRFPIGSSSAGGTGGTSTHYHDVTGGTDGQGSHSHGFSGSGGLSGARAKGDSDNPSGTSYFFGTGGGLETAGWNHHHYVNVPVEGGSVSISGSTDGVGNHSHSLTGGRSDTTNHTPPWYAVVYCRKN